MPAKPAPASRPDPTRAPRRAEMTPPHARQHQSDAHRCNTDRRYNRVRVLLAHAPRYSIRGQARLAHDVGVARSTISRLVNGRTVPSAALANDVTAALSRRLGTDLDRRDVFSPDGAYPTPSGCSLCSCHGCLPPDAWGADDVLRPEWRGQRPGDWSLARPMAQETTGGKGAK